MYQVLSQIESYDNLIPFMVDALKSCTDLSNDVMSYCIINQVQKTIMKNTFKRIICEECSAGNCSFSIYIFFSSLQLLILDMLTLHIKV